MQHRMDANPIRFLPAFYESHNDDILVINNAQIEVDTCEIWATATYRRTDGGLVASDGPRLLPQTITIQHVQAGWFITSVKFFDAPSFCD